MRPKATILYDPVFPADPFARLTRRLHPIHCVSVRATTIATGDMEPVQAGSMKDLLQFFCTYCPCQPNATTMRTTAGVIVNPCKIPEIYVNPTSAQCQTDGRRAGLKIRSSQEGVGSSPTFGTSNSRPPIHAVAPSARR